MKGMDFVRTCQHLIAIEECFDVTRLMLGSLHVWPIMKLPLCSFLMGLERGSRLENQPQVDEGIRTALTKAVHQEGSFHQAAEKLWSRTSLTIESQLLSFPSLQGSGLLFFNRPEEAYQMVEGLPYNPVLDPILELAATEHPTFRFEIGAHSSPRCLPTGFYDMQRAETAWMAGRIRDSGDFQPLLDEAISSITEFKALLHSLFPGRIAEGSRLFSQAIQQVLVLQDVFRSTLAHLQPRAVFLSCFYDTYAMGLTAACRESGIAVIDVQHGFRGPYHGHCSHMLRVPTGGYGVIPNLFWQWSERLRDDLRAWPPFAGTEHRAIVGGHPWITKWTADDAPLLGQDERDFLARLDSAPRRILISLQWALDNLPVPPVILDAMEAAPANWYWMIRMHPLSAYTREAVEEATRHIGRVDVRHATDLPLPILLAHTDHHVTRFSSTAAEADAFDVPTILIDPFGLECFAESVADGTFIFADDPDTIVTTIAASRRCSRPADKPKLVDYGIDLARQALREIVLIENNTPSHILD